ncbi:hypothetical protein BDZ89DRAFT_758549 [Hymenopellis radicata]|nr:hypothetical protein BDZ89DRAFT_758549 [Hymenopellis radicata]
MSLISDTDYLIHRLRLTYLREVEDPYGPRLISLDPSHTSNPYILAASLADVDKWPELAMPSSPQLSGDEEPHGGAKLKYTTTIMGGRTGGLGLRVHAKRASTSKRASTLAGTPRQDDMVKNFIGGHAPVSEEIVVPEPDEETEKPAEVNTVDVQVQGPTVVEEAPVAKVPQFIPRFKGAAEMEKRRMQRMAARRGPGAAPAPQVSFDDSSSDEDIPVAAESSSDSDFGDAAGANDSMDDDEFDPDFAATTTQTPGIHFDSASDMVSDMNSVLSLSEPESSSQPNMRSRPQLSPVSIRTHSKGQPKSHSPSQPQETRPRKTSAPPRILAHAPPEMVFTRKPIPPIMKQTTSSLSAMLKSTGTTSNPFAEMYAAISGRGENASSDVQVYFPHAVEPRGRAMDLNVRRDATVEEVIGFALWTYWEEGWKPKLDEGLNGEEDERWATHLSAVGWILRITEDDGEVDDDFPPPDRMGKIVKFNADGYAVLEASPAQIAQNQILESKIQRRPSRTTTGKKMEKSNSGLAVPVVPAGPGSSASNLGSLRLSTSLGPLSSHGPQMFLRIRVADAAGAGHVSTTIPVSAEMYMQEALEMVCKKRKLDTPKEYALMLADMSILIPLDRTVASLQGKRELVIIKRSMLGGDVLKATGKTTDPNASIFKRMSDTPAEVKLSSELDYAAAYKKYTIARKMPMLVAKQEKTLAIDGVYVHIMPSTNKGKAVFDNGKTYSYHIKSIADIQQSTKSSSVFKLVLNRGAGSKRYDFEADTPKLAAEIVQTVRNMKSALERSGTVNKSRRSRHVS